MKTPVYKIEVMVVDHDGLGPTEVAQVLQNANYPNDCISPKVMRVEWREVEWSDEHPLNKRETLVAAYKELFNGGIQ